MNGPEADAAARLLERLLSDTAYRERFRAFPVAALREAGLPSVAEEMAVGGGKLLDTLDERESRSSLAGMFMAAALEGAAMFDFSREALAHLDDLPSSVGNVLSRVHLPAIAEAQAAAPPVHGVERIGSVPGQSAAEAGEFRAVTPEQAAAAGTRAQAPEQVAPPPVAPNEPSPSARAVAAADSAPSAKSSPVDPGQYGAEGSGGSPSPEVQSLLHNDRVTFDANGIADMKAGRMDPRIVSVLTAISQDHKISISATISDHDKSTSGGSISNHHYGRAVDISVVDGQAVNPGNAAAREVAMALSSLPASIRPSEVGSPWQLPGTADFSDSAHQNHLHIAYDDPIASSWTPPEDLAASGGAAADVAPASADTPEISADVGESGDSSDSGDSGDSDDGGDEPGGLEDPGGDTDAEADAESDGGDGDDNDSVADDPSDEQEADEGNGEDSGDSGVDGDHDDSSDTGSDDTDDSDGSDGGEDSGDGGDGGGDSGGDADGGGQIDLGDAAGGYPGDDAEQAEIAAWMGSAAQKRGLPPELPVMAGLVESGLRNLSGGDADSVGFFQMRVGIWNQGDYAGYPDRAELQLKWFLDQAAAVKQQRIAAGKSVNDPGSYGEWIADVERPAAQYRGRYQLRLEEARGLLRQGAQSGDGGGGGSDDGGAQLEPVADGGGSGASGPRAAAALATAKKYLGTPYVWGGSTPQTGFDCSGLVQWAYAKAGIQIPRTTQLQILASNGKAVDRKHLVPGDLVFFRDSSGDVHHVGMSLGGDKFIHAPHTGDVVKISSLKEPYYAQQFTGGRRFDRSAGQGAQAAAAAVGANGDEGYAPGVVPDAARAAEAALLRDAAEAQRPGTLLFEAVRAQELSHANEAQVLRAVAPSAST